jgi:two-component SAPR family response regulator
MNEMKSHKQRKDDVKHIDTGEPPHFLVISDDKHVVSQVKAGISKNGCDVTVIENPLKAKFAFKMHCYDVIFIDMSISTPQITCFELYRFFKSLDKHVRTCFMTSFEVNRKEFFRVFPSIQIDCLMDKKDITLAKIDDMYHTLLPS